MNLKLLKIKNLRYVGLHLCMLLVFISTSCQNKIEYKELNSLQTFEQWRETIPSIDANDYFNWNEVDSFMALPAYLRPAAVGYKFDINLKKQASTYLLNDSIKV